VAGAPSGWALSSSVSSIAVMVVGGQIGQIELGWVCGRFGPKWSILSAYTWYHLVGEMSCNGNSHMVQGAVDAQVEVVEGWGKEIEFRWEADQYQAYTLIIAWGTKLAVVDCGMV
jgi:hypothetical protein